MSKPVNVTATGDVTAAPSTGCVVNNVCLTAGAAAAARATIRENGSTGTILGELAAVIGDTTMLAWNGADVRGQLHVTLSGAGASVTIELA